MTANFPAASLLAQTPVPTAVLRGPELVFEMANPAYVEAVGGRAVLGKPLLEALPEAKGQGFDELLRGVMRTGNAHVGHETLMRLQRNGRMEDRYFTFIYAPLRAAGGDIDSVIAIVNDVTDQVTARNRIELLAAEARKSADDLADFVDNASVAMHWVGPDGVILWANRAELDMLGYSREEYVGRHISEFHADRAVIDDMLERLRCDEKLVNHEARLRRKDGSLRHVLVNSSVLWQDGRFVHTRCFTRDITERKLALDALRASEERLQMELADARLLHELSAQMIQEENAAAIYERILDAAVAIMRSEYASMQMLYPEGGQGGELRLLAFRGFDPQAARFWERVRADSASACGAALRSGARIIVPDVETCAFMAGTDDLATYRGTGILAVQTTPLVSRSGRLVGMISTHWRARHQPSERDLRLLDIVARQAADVLERKAAEQALRESDRRKDEFLAMLSHELRNPLAPIRNAVTLLGEADGDAQVRKLAREILDRQVNHMIRLVDDLLDISRISRGSIGLCREPVEMAAVIDSALETSRPHIEEGGHRLELRVPAERIIVLADAVRLAQVVANLLNNAAKYTPRGGAIELSVHAGPGTVAITVRDNGIGIAPEWLPRVFEMFSQAEATRGRMPGGLGIGLALARQLVELHGGTIEARSDGPGLGSAFTVRIPVPASTQALVLAMPAREAPIAPRRILVVDDNVDAAESLGMVLEQMGHDVHLAYDGHAALAAARQNPPEIILADIGLPELDGFALAARLREDRRFDNVPIIAVTGYGQDVDRKRARQAGFDEHLVKPVDAGMLRRALHLIDCKTL